MYVCMYALLCFDCMLAFPLYLYDLSHIELILRINKNVSYFKVCDNCIMCKCMMYCSLYSMPIVGQKPSQATLVAFCFCPGIFL